MKIGVGSSLNAILQEAAVGEPMAIAEQLLKDQFADAPGPFFPLLYPFLSCWPFRPLAREPALCPVLNSLAGVPLCGAHGRGCGSLDCRPDPRERLLMLRPNCKAAQLLHGL